MNDTRPASILHETREKYKQLTASLVLTSSFISRKIKVNQMRQLLHKRLFMDQDCRDLLLTNKIPLREQSQNKPPPEPLLSGIQTLKRHAKLLEEDEIDSIGCTRQYETLNPQPKNTRKVNRRRILKGRPDMYATLQRRKFLEALMDIQQQKTEGICSRMVADIAGNIQIKGTPNTPKKGLRESLQKFKLNKPRTCSELRSNIENIESGVGCQQIKSGHNISRHQQKTTCFINRRYSGQSIE